MKLLLEADFLRRVNQGCYVVNPDVIFKGSRTGRLNVLNTYTDIEKSEASEVSVDDKIKSLQATIASLTEALEKLVSEKAAQSDQDQLPGQMNFDDLAS